jgi:hypothetical protein
MTGTLSRYFGLKFCSTLAAVMAGIFMLIILLDYVEQMRRLSDAPNVSALLIAKISLFRVPQIAERILPFCILIGAMSCYLSLSRRLELVVSRAAGSSPPRPSSWRSASASSERRSTIPSPPSCRSARSASKRKSPAVPKACRQP